MSDRRTDFEREWLRLERRNRIAQIYLPLLFVGLLGACALLAYQTATGRILLGAFSAAALPLALWMGSRK